MRLDAARTVPTRTRPGQALVSAFAVALFLMSAGVAMCQDDANRGSRDSTAAIRLPPRTTGHDSASPSSRKGSGTNSGLWTTVISLAAIVGCMGMAAYWLKPYLGVPRGLPIDAIEILGRRSIEQKVAINLVRCGSRVLVLGISPEGVRTLSEITDPKEVRDLVAACQAPRDGSSTLQKSAVEGAQGASAFLSRSDKPPFEESRRA